MPQTFSKQSQSGEIGVAVVHELVSRLSHAWHPRGNLDFGIDGQIELCDPITGEALNRHLQVQVKSRKRLDGKTNEGFYFSCSSDHVEYWLKSTLPVLLIVVDPTQDLAWWKDVSAWFASQEHAATGRVEFDWEGDLIGPQTRLAWLALGAPSHAPAIEVRQETERLDLSLLPVTGTPPNVYFARTDLTSVRAAAERLRKHSSGSGFTPFVLRDKMVYSFTDLRQPGARLLTVEGAEEDNSETWSNGSEDQQRIFKMLLLQQLRADKIADLDYDRKKALLFFRAPDTGDCRLISLTGRGKPREVVKVERRADDDGLVGYTRHFGMRVRFIRIGARCHLAIRPDWRFTTDGFRPHPFADRLLSGIKGYDRHTAVHAQIRWWARWLQQKQLNLLEETLSGLLFGDLCSTEISFSAEPMLKRQSEEARFSAEGGLFE